MARIKAISGLAEKGPACFLIETGDARLLLDLGEGPQPGLLPDIAAIGPIDALLLSHQHGDHVGALRFRAEIGNPPVYASATVCRFIAKECPATPLPLQGVTEICGVAVTTGRSGHAPGGVWMHFAIGDGLLYMGDYCVESLIYPFDPPPAAAILITDASYGDYEKPFETCFDALKAAMGDGKGVVMPLTAQGRGAELALHLLRQGLTPVLDGPVLEAVRLLTGEDAGCVIPATLPELRRLAAAPPPADPFAGIVLTAPATATGALAMRAIQAMDEGAALRVILTGYVPPGTPAEALTKAGRAQFVRWNIHPRLSDNTALVKAVEAKTVLPAFGDKKALPAWQKAFAPCRVVTEGAVEF